MQDGPFPTEQGMGMSSQTTYAFTLGPSHPTLSNLLEISYMKRVASSGSMHDTGCLGLVHGTTQRDGMGREEEGRLRMGNTCIPVADSF